MEEKSRRQTFIVDGSKGVGYWMEGNLRSRSSRTEKARTCNIASGFQTFQSSKSALPRRQF